MDGHELDVSTPAPTVLLRHELPDGSWHVDWMLAREPDARRSLVTFRLARRLDRLGPGESMAAESIGRHRPAYLEYEGPVAGDRGRVSQLARGCITAIEPRGPGWRLQIRWDRGRRQQLRLEPPAGPGPWRVREGW